MRISGIKAAIFFSAFLVFSLAFFPVWAADQEVILNTDANSGGGGNPGDLRYAIANVDDGDTITFNLAGSDTVTLTSADIEITKGMTINGINLHTGSAVTVTAPPNARVFNIAINQADKTVAISNLTITGGNVAGNGGGILFNTGLATVTLNLENSAISGNTASQYGGGLYQQNGGALNLDGCTVSGNTASDIGGGLNINIGTATIRNSTISGNTATNNSGGIGSGSATIYLINTTISGNNGGTFGPGGFYNSNKTYLLNTIVINNTGPAGKGDIWNGGTTTASYYSWYDAANVTGIITTNPQAPNQTTAYTAGDLGPLQDNGGPTHTMALSPVAPAYQTGAFVYYNETDGYYFYDNQGTPAAHKLTDWATAPSNPQEADKITTDQRGATRNTPPSMGAFEYFGVDYVTNGAGTGWNVAANWNVDTGAGAVTANDPPTAGNSTSITLNHDMNVNAGVSIDQTIVSAGKTLAVDNGFTLTIANGDGTDLTVAGNLTNSGTLTCADGSEVLFSGAFASAFTSSGSTTFKTLILNKDAPATALNITGTADMSVSTALTVTRGTMSLSGWTHNLLLGGSLSIGTDGRWIEHGDNAYYVQFTGDACTVSDTSSTGPQNLGHVKVD